MALYRRARPRAYGTYRIARASVSHRHSVGRQICYTIWTASCRAHQYTVSGLKYSLILTPEMKPPPKYSTTNGPFVEDPLRFTTMDELVWPSCIGMPCVTSSMSSGVVPAALRERSVISLRRSSRVFGLGALPPASSSYDQTSSALLQYIGQR